MQTKDVQPLKQSCQITHFKNSPELKTQLLSQPKVLKMQAMVIQRKVKLVHSVRLQQLVFGHHIGAIP